jgi:hypothetical protein
MHNTPIQGQDLGICFEDSDEEIRVTNVAPDSPAARLGLEPGDAIVGVYGHPVHHAGVWKWLLCHDVDYVQLQIRDGRTGSIVTRYLSLAQASQNGNPGMEHSSGAARSPLGRAALHWQGQDQTPPSSSPRPWGKRRHGERGPAPRSSSDVGA